MTCPSVVGTGMFKWNCVLNRCNLCPQLELPSEELSSESFLNPISYGTYEFQVKCKLHGLLKRDSSFCHKYREMSQRNDSFEPEKITKKKEITILDASIDKFHNETYIPMR